MELDQILSILEESEVEERSSPWGYQLTYKYPVGGPVSLIKETRCSQKLVNGKKCNCPAGHAIYGMPRCVICCIRQLNEMLVSQAPVSQ